MTLTLSPEIEQVLTVAAAKLGETPGKLAELAVEEKYGRLLETLEERRERIHALMGSSRHLGPSRILEDRAEEVEREERLRQA